MYTVRASCTPKRIQKNQEREAGRPGARGNIGGKDPAAPLEQPWIPCRRKKHFHIKHHPRLPTTVDLYNGSYRTTEQPLFYQGLSWEKNTKKTGGWGLSKDLRGHERTNCIRDVRPMRMKSTLLIVAMPSSLLFRVGRTDA